MRRKFLLRASCKSGLRCFPPKAQQALSRWLATKPPHLESCSEGCTQYSVEFSMCSCCLQIATYCIQIAFWTPYLLVFAYWRVWLKDSLRLACIHECTYVCYMYTLWVHMSTLPICITDAPLNARYQLEIGVRLTAAAAFDTVYIKRASVDIALNWNIDSNMAERTSRVSGPGQH